MSDFERENMSDDEREWYDGTLRGQMDKLRREATRLGAGNALADLDHLDATLADHRDIAIREHFDN